MNLVHAACALTLIPPCYAGIGDNRRMAGHDVPSMLSGLNGYSTEVLFTVGETVNGYTPPGVIDGLGAYKLDDSTIRIMANHELLNFRSYPYDVESISGLVGARVSYIDIDVMTLEPVDAGLAYERVYNHMGVQPSTIAEFVDPGFGGFSRFCSSALLEAGQFDKANMANEMRKMKETIEGKQLQRSLKTGGGKKASAHYGLEDMIYFAPEEDGGFFNPVGGAFWAIDVVNKDIWHLPDLGRGSWENAGSIDTGSKDTVALILMDDSSPFSFNPADEEDDPVPLYMYYGAKDPYGGFVERNGLKDGKLYVLVPNDATLRVPSTFNGAGNKLGAMWVEIDNSQDETMKSTDGSTGYDYFGYPTQSNLVTQAEDIGAFGFSRPEDVHVSPTDGTTVVISSTGVDTFDGGADTFGTLYLVTTNFDDMSVELSILYDGTEDLQRKIRSPDNLVWANDGMIYVNEDEAEETSLDGEPFMGENATNPFESLIVKIDPALGPKDHNFIMNIAEVDRSVVLDASLDNMSAAVDTDAGNYGEWETSGLIDVTSLFGEYLSGRDVDTCKGDTILLTSVQAHGIEDQDDFNVDSRITDSDLVEGGQLVLLIQ